jgi:hypothetical protein
MLLLVPAPAPQRCTKHFLSVSNCKFPVRITTFDSFTRNFYSSIFSVHIQETFSLDFHYVCPVSLGNISCTYGNHFPKSSWNISCSPFEYLYIMQIKKSYILIRLQHDTWCCFLFRSRLRLRDIFPIRIRTFDSFTRNFHSSKLSVQIQENFSLKFLLRMSCLFGKHFMYVWESFP